MLLPIHIAAGGLAIVLGAVALSVKKGGTIHRRSGLLFVYAMLVMGVTASFLGLRNGPSDPNVYTGLLTGYFVITALTTVRPVSSWTRFFNVAGLVVVVGLGLATIARGVEAWNCPGRMTSTGVPSLMLFFLGTVMMLAALGDVRVLRSGVARGAARLRRHLWRMCFALFIAAGSFFSVRERVAKILPEFFASGPMRLLPILLVFVAMFYWLWKLRRRAAGSTTPDPAGLTP